MTLASLLFGRQEEPPQTEKPRPARVTGRLRRAPAPEQTATAAEQEKAQERQDRQENAASPTLISDRLNRFIDRR